MGNRDDFDDLFDDDDFNFDDDDDLSYDAGQDTVDDFSFDGFDDDGFGTLDDDSLDTDLLRDEEFDDLDDETFFTDEEERSGPSRTFIILAGIMIIFFLLALGLVLFLALNQDDSPSPIQVTSTFIAQLNATSMVQLEQTQTQAVENAIATETQQALDLVATQTAQVVQVTQTAEAIIAQTQEAEANATASAQALIAQQTADAALALTQTAEAEQGQETEEPVDETPDTLPTSGQSDVGDVALTATALFQVLQTPIVTPGQNGTGGGGSSTATPTTGTGNQLPQTGLFDDVSGGQNMGVVMLAAFGLIGVIFGARRLRTVNGRKED